LGLTRRFDGWTVFTLLAALAVAGPLLGLPVSFITAPGSLDRFSGLVPEALAATAVLLVGVGVGVLVLGTALAALVSFCDFPGRAWIEWALVLPLAMPGYVFTLFALGLEVPGIRSELGAVCVFTLVLYPYVYLLARAAFLAQSRTLVEAARGLGLSRGAAVARVAIPLARPAILGGVALALMETLADFGTVNLLGVRSFTDAIYRVWFTALDRDAAMQLATLLVSITLTLLLLERLARGRARYHQHAAGGDVVAPVRLHGPAAFAAAAFPLVLVGVVVAAPVAQLTAWSVESIGEGLLAPEFATAARNSVLLAGVSALLVPIVATLLAYGAHRRRGGAGRYDRLRPPGLGGGGRGDRAARLDRPPHRRRTSAHGHSDWTALRLPRSLPGARVGLRGVRAAADPAHPRRGRAWTGSRPARRARARARADDPRRPRDGGAARVRRGHEGASRHAAAPADGR
jgi:iron(III) transport system permease protein